MQAIDLAMYLQHLPPGTACLMHVYWCLCVFWVCWDVDCCVWVISVIPYYIYYVYRVYRTLGPLSGSDSWNESSRMPLGTIQIMNLGSWSGDHNWHHVHDVNYDHDTWQPPPGGGISPDFGVDFRGLKQPPGVDFRGLKSHFYGQNRSKHVSGLIHVMCQKWSGGHSKPDTRRGPTTSGDLLAKTPIWEKWPFWPLLTFGDNWGHSRRLIVRVAVRLMIFGVRNPLLAIFGHSDCFSCFRDYVNLCVSEHVSGWCSCRLRVILEIVHFECFGALFGVHFECPKVGFEVIFGVWGRFWGYLMSQVPYAAYLPTE